MLKKCNEQTQGLILNKVQEIFNVISPQSKFTTNDLWDGYSGVYLFQNLYNRYSNIPFKRFDNNNLILDNDNFGLGFSGQIWSSIFINPSISSIYDDFTKHIEKSILIDIKNLHYSLVYGGLGKLVYLMQFYKSSNKYNTKLLGIIAELFINNITVTPNGCGWINKYYLYNRTKSNEINISMAQGITGILMSLTIISPFVTIEVQEKISKTIYAVFEFIKSIELAKFDKCKKIPTHFYSMNEKDIHFNRIGWAFGDASTALVLYNSSLIVKSKEMRDYSINLLKQISKFTNENNKYCVDAALSQGTSGVAHIFNRMFKLTGVKEFDDGRMYWLNETLKMAKYKDGLANYKFWVDKEIGLKNDTGFYEGIAGIGLVLLGFLTDDVEDLDWDRCLLLS
jgi:hypothetical protein